MMEHDSNLPGKFGGVSRWSAINKHDIIVVNGRGMSSKRQKLKILFIKVFRFNEST